MRKRHCCQYWQSGAAECASCRTGGPSPGPLNQRRTCNASTSCLLLLLKSSTAALPPGTSTRCSSESARGMSATFLSPYPMVAASKDAPSKGRSRASPCTHWTAAHRCHGASAAAASSLRAASCHHTSTTDLAENKPQCCIGSGIGCVGQLKAPDMSRSRYQSIRSAPIMSSRRRSPDGHGKHHLDPHCAHTAGSTSHSSHGSGQIHQQ